MGLDMGQKNRHALLYYCRYNVLSKRSLLQLAPSGLLLAHFSSFFWWPTSTMMSLADFCASYASTVLTPPKEQTYFGRRFFIFQLPQCVVETINVALQTEYEWL